MSFLATVYEDFSRLKYGMKSAKFKTPYTKVHCFSFEEAYYFFRLASLKGLSCVICSEELHRKAYEPYYAVIAISRTYRENTCEEALEEHFDHFERIKKRRKR